MSCLGAALVLKRPLAVAEPRAAGSYVTPCQQTTCGSLPRKGRVNLTLLAPDQPLICRPEAEVRHPAFDARHHLAYACPFAAMRRRARNCESVR